MNARLKAYLRKLGLGADATDEQAWEFYRSLRGSQASVANCLNHNEADEAARTTCDLMLRSAGFNPEDPTQMLQREEPQQPQEPQRQQPQQQPPSNGPDLEQVRREAQQQVIERSNAIRSLGEMAGCSEEFIRGLESDLTISVDAARQRIHEEWRARTRAQNIPSDVPNSGPAVHSRNSQTDFNADALRCALLSAAGVDDPAQMRRWYSPSGRLQEVRDDDALQRARDRGYELQGLSPRNFIVRALALDGIRCEPTVDSINEAWASRSAAAMSTTSLVNIFTQTFGARFLASYGEAEDTTEGWVGVEENPNYLPNEAVRMGLVEGLAQVPRGAEAEDITLADTNRFTRVHRYGRKAVFDEIDIQNDRWGAITGELPRAMGLASRRLRPDLVYSILLANPTMADGVALFHATHGNLAAGAWSEAAIEAAWLAMASQRIDGVNVTVMPRWVIHPVALDFAIDKTLNPNAVMIATGTTDTVRPNYNAIGRKGLGHRGDPRLDNGVVDPKTGLTYAGDANDWYLVADGPAPIVVTYLEGRRRAPRFRSGVLDRGSFGVWFDVQMALGATAVEYRTIAKRTA